MKRGKIGAFLLGAALCLTAWSGQASAEGNIWMDENAEILPYQYKKVVVYPIRYLQEQDGNYETAPKYNKMLLDRLNKRGKGVNWMGFSPMLEEKKHILRDNPKYDHLRDHFATEKERAAAVYDATAADGYLLPHVRWDQVRVDHSPATWATVKIETYYDEKNGPKGNRDKLNYHSWHESHLIPAHDSNLRMLDMDFSLLDREGNKSLTPTHYYPDYERSTEHARNQIFKKFPGDWSRLRRDKPQEAAAGAPTLGFRNLNLPASAGRDEYSIKTIYYAYKDAAGDRLKGVKVDYTPNAGQYYVTGTVDTYQRGQTWHPPYADTSTYLDETKKFTWTDADGNSHEGKREYYKTSVHDYYGYYTFWYKVGASLRLVDASTGQTIFQHHYAADDTERFGNALRSVFNDFYRDVERSIGVKVD